MTEMSESRIDDMMNRLQRQPASNLLNKREAAAFLGVSTRAINRYVAAGRLKVSYRDAGGSTTSFYDPADLEALKKRKLTELNDFSIKRSQNEETYRRLSALKKEKEAAVKEARKTLASLESDLEALERTIGLVNSMNLGMLKKSPA